MCHVWLRSVSIQLARSMIVSICIVKYILTDLNLLTYILTNLITFVNLLTYISVVCSRFLFVDTGFCRWAVVRYFPLYLFDSLLLLTLITVMFFLYRFIIDFILESFTHRSLYTNQSVVFLNMIMVICWYWFPFFYFWTPFYFIFFNKTEVPNGCS